MGLGLAGPGRYSVDHATGHCLDRPWVVAAGFTASALAAACVLRRRARTVRAASADLESFDAQDSNGGGTGDGPAA